MSFSTDASAFCATSGRGGRFFGAGFFAGFFFVMGAQGDTRRGGRQPGILTIDIVAARSPGGAGYPA
jgi:hypothetical protein